MNILHVGSGAAMAVIGGALALFGAKKSCLAVIVGAVFFCLGGLLVVVGVVA